MKYYVISDYSRLNFDSEAPVQVPFGVFTVTQNGRILDRVDGPFVTHDAALRAVSELLISNACNGILSEAYGWPPGL